jgi:hypothetical protein
MAELIRVKTYQPTVKSMQDTKMDAVLEECEPPRNKLCAKGAEMGTVLAECKAFAKKLTRGELHMLKLKGWKCYFDICASSHTFLDKCFLTDVTDEKKVTSGRCNLGATNTATSGRFGGIHICINKIGITNLMLVPMLESKGCILSIHTSMD